MDTILVVNAGSSSVKFQVFGVDSDGRLRREIKGQMDGIGSRPRLRATDAGGDTLAERAYPIEAVPDVSAALMLAGGWLLSAYIRWSEQVASLGCDDPTEPHTSYVDQDHVASYPDISWRNASVKAPHADASAATFHRAGDA